MILVRHFGQHVRTHHRRNRLHRRQHAIPVARRLIARRRGIGGLPHVFRNRAGRVSPHILKGKPAEKLHQSHRPKRFGGLFQKIDPTDLFMIGARINTVIAGIGFRVVFFHLEDGQRAGDHQNRRAHIKRHNHRLRHHAFGRRVGQADIGKHKRQHGCNHPAGVRQKALNAVSIAFLFVVHHIAHHHLKGLHRHIR